MRPCVMSRCIAIGFAVVIAYASAAATDVCRVGAQLHLQSRGAPEESYLRHMAAFVECNMADYVLLVAQGLNDEDRDRAVRYLAERRIPFLLQEGFPTSEDWFAEPNPNRHYDEDDYHRIRAIAGDLFLGVHWGELDSTGLKPEDYLPPKVYAYPTRRKVKEAFIQYVGDRLQLFKDRFNAPFAHSSAVLYHSLFAEAGVDMLCSEIGENIPNVNMMIASNRGAARAYGRSWMIDFSTWWSPRGNAGELVSPREGHTPWCMFSSLLSAAMGGADYVQLEVDWAAYDKEFRLLPWGQALKTIYHVTRQIGPRGATRTRFAILLGHENGWPGVGWRVGDVRGAGLFDGIRHQFMQTRDADLSLKVLDVFYPGFERCGWDPEYPGFLAESPLGTLDIVPDNLPTQAYRRYACLVALGYHRMTPELRDTLIDYVNNGGVLVCGDTLFLDEREKPLPPRMAEPLIGCTYRASDRTLVSLYQPSGKLDKIPGYASSEATVEWQTHRLHPVRLTTGRAVAWLIGRDGTNRTYIVENRMGKGRVFFVTAVNMVGCKTHQPPTMQPQEPFLYANLLYRFLHTLEDHLGDGIRFSPWTSLEHVFNEKPDGTAMLLVMNHGDMDYRRDAAMKNPLGFTSARIVQQGTWQGAQPGNELPLSQTGETLTWSFNIPPKSFVLFEFCR